MPILILQVKNGANLEVYILNSILVSVKLYESPLHELFGTWCEENGAENNLYKMGLKTIYIIGKSRVGLSFA